MEPIDLVSEGDFTRPSIACEVIDDVLVWRGADEERQNLIEPEARNFVPDAERWDRADWVLSGVTRAAADGPDAAGMAWALTETATSALHGISRSVTTSAAGKAHSVRWIVKPEGRPAASFVVSADGALLGSVHVRWSDGATSVRGEGVTASAQLYVAGFWRITLSLILPAQFSVSVYAATAWPVVSDLGDAYLGSASPTVALTGAHLQVEVGSATSPIPTEGSVWLSPTTPDVVCSAAYSDGTTWLAGGDGGALRVGTGQGAWVIKNSGLGKRNIRAIAKAGAYWILGGDDGAFAQSNNLDKIRASAFHSFGTTRSILAFAVSGTTYLAVGTLGAAASTTPTTAWTLRTLGLAETENATCAAYHNGKWWVGGDQGTLRSSSNLSTWETVATGLPEGGALRGMHSDGTTLVIVGDFGGIVTSTDGVTWTIRTSGTLRRLNAVTKWDDRWWIGGDRRLFISADAVTWMPRNLPETTSEVRALSGSGSMLVACGMRPGLSEHAAGWQGWRGADREARVEIPIVEDDAPEYSTDDQYIVGDVVMLNHRLYESLIDHRNVWPPTSLDVYWLDLGPTRKWAWADQAVKTQTTWTDGPLQMLLRPGARVDEIAMLNVTASRVSVDVVDGVTDQVKSSRTLSLVAGMQNPSWYEFFFASRANVDSGFLVELGAASIDSLQVTFEPIDGEVRVGLLVVGRLEKLGNSLFGSRLGILDFSVQERDDWGNATLLQRDYADRLEQDFVLPTSKVAQVRRRLAQLRARPMLWVSDPCIPATMVWGWYEEFEITIPRWNESTANISLRGMI